jgi:hypothetical protein
MEMPMIRGVVLVLALLALPGPGLAADQAPRRGDTRLEIRREPSETTRRRHVVRPLPPAGQAQADAARVEAELARRAREDEVIREATRPSVRRPDLGRDVVQGIQQRHLNRALRR